MAKKESKTKVKRIRSTEDKNLLISALVYIVLGAMLCIFRTQMLNWAMTIAGIIAIVKRRPRLRYRHVGDPRAHPSWRLAFPRDSSPRSRRGPRGERYSRTRCLPQILEDKHRCSSRGDPYDSHRRSAHRQQMAGYRHVPYRYRRNPYRRRRVYVLRQKTRLIH